VKPSKQNGIARRTASAPLAEVKKYQEEFQRRLGRKVDIQTNGKKGWIRFEFYSPWDMEMLCQRLGLISKIEKEPIA